MYKRHSIYSIINFLKLFIVVIGISLASCSGSDDEPRGAGEEALAALNGRLYVNGQFRFPLEAPDGQYYGYTDDRSEAKEKAEEMVGHELVDDAYTLTLPDDYGYVKVVPNADPTIYYTIYIAVKGETAKTCNITDIAWFDDNAFPNFLTFKPEKLL